MRPPEQQVAEYSHVKRSSEHDNRESSNIFHHRSEDNWTDRVNNAKADHDVTDLVNSEGARDISL